MKRFKVAIPESHAFFVMSNKPDKVWLVAVTAKAGRPTQIIAVEGTYRANAEGTYEFLVTQHEFNGRQIENVKPVAGRTNINKALDSLQDRMDGVYTRAGEEWQRY